MDSADEILGFNIDLQKFNLVSMLGNSKRVELTAIFANEFKRKEDSYILRGNHLPNGCNHIHVNHEKHYKGQEYVLLKCLCDEFGVKIAEHVWVLYNKKMKNLDLKIGDKIKFFAKVYKYAKNTKSCDPNNLRTHWSLRSIADIEKIGNIL